MVVQCWELSSKKTSCEEKLSLGFVRMFVEMLGVKVGWVVESEMVGGSSERSQDLLEM